MILIQNSPILNQLLEKGKEEKIGRGFGDAKQNSRELEREREANLPKECIKGFIVRRAIVSIGRLTACFFYS